MRNMQAIKKAVDLLNAKENGDMDACASLFSDAVNSFNSSASFIAEYIISRGTDFSMPFEVIADTWVLRMADDDFAFDGRNEYAVSVARKLVKCKSFWKIMSTAEIQDRAEKFVKKMEREHKTLQQAFSAVVFRYLQIKYRWQLDFPEELEEVGLDTETWWKMPLV